MRSTLFLLIAAGFFSSCYTYYYVPLTQGQQDVRTYYTHGVPTQYRQLDQYDIFCNMIARDGEAMLLDLLVQNRGETPFTFEPGEIKVFGYNDRGVSRALKVFTAEQFIKRRNRQTAAAVTVAAVATIATTAALVNNMPESAEGGSTDADEALWLLAAPPPLMIIDNGNNNTLPFADVQAARTNDGMLRRHTLFGNEALSGHIRFSTHPDYKYKFRVEVPMDGKIAVFEFQDKMRRF
jgi:hypothetical protein